LPLAAKVATEIPAPPDLVLGILAPALCWYRCWQGYSIMCIGGATQVGKEET